MKIEEKLITIASEVDAAIKENANLVKERCLYSSILMADMLTQAGIENRLFQGSTDFMNDAGLRMLDKRVKSPTEQESSRFKKLWEENNCRWVSVRANVVEKEGVGRYSSPSDKMQLGGHVANLVRGENGFAALIDMTAYQFDREYMRVNGTLAVQIEPESYETGVVIRTIENSEGQTLHLSYRYEAVERLKELDAESSDLNPKRHTAAYESAVERLRKNGLI